VLEAVQHAAVSQASELLSADVGLAGLGGRQHAPLSGGDIRQLKIPNQSGGASALRPSSGDSRSDS